MCLSDLWSHAMPGYVTVALGLLSEDESVALLLGTAEIEIGEATQVQLGASRTICKLVSFHSLFNEC